MNIEKLSIIIPAYNEGNTIHLILNKIKSVKLIDNIQKEIIIVNDYSNDHTEQAVIDYQAANPELNLTKAKALPSIQVLQKLPANISLSRMLIWSMIPTSIMIC
jgi:glycosyltransferase involved in cell wall biosynthesis